MRQTRATIWLLFPAYGGRCHSPKESFRHFNALFSYQQEHHHQLLFSTIFSIHSYFERRKVIADKKF